MKRFFSILFNRTILKIALLVDEPHEKIIANILMIVGFAIIYKLIGIDDIQFSNQKVFDWNDAFYFSFVVHFTLGFGDIYPLTIQSRGVVMIHTVLFWIINLIDNDFVKYIKIKS